MVCAACTADVPDEDVFCENCGVRLPSGEPGAGTCSCGAPASDVDEEGFCLCCGRRVRRPASDHIEQVISTDCAGVSDRGLKHDRNEDRFALVATERGYGMVVCDGVSATTHSEEASAAVAEVLAKAIEETLRGEEDSPAAEAVIADAIARAAAGLASRCGVDAGDTAPSTTAVVAMVVGNLITVGWVGDSRAYWIDEEGARLLTRDHSWMNMVLESGAMSKEEAQVSPQAHAITRWIGADADGASAPEIITHRAGSDGTLLLCTDGLWNYADSPEEIADLLGLAGGKDALAAAGDLVNFANEQGGRDNITVAVLRMRTEATESTPGALD